MTGSTSTDDSELDRDRGRGGCLGRWRSHRLTLGRIGGHLSPSIQERIRSGHCRAEVRRLVALRRRRASSAWPGASPTPRRPATRSSSRLRDGRQHRRAARPRRTQVSPLPPARELDMLLTAGERISMALVAMAISDLGFDGPVVHRLAGRRDHRRRRTARPRSSTSRPAGSGSAIDEGAHRDRGRLPGRQPADQGDHHPRPRRHRHHRGRAGGRARGRRLRDLHRRRRRLHRRPADRPGRAQARHGSPTRRCWSWLRAAPRCCTCARSSTPGATTSRSTSGRRSAPSRAQLSRASINDPDRTRE